jgi:hypothetical protein
MALAPERDQAIADARPPLETPKVSVTIRYDRDIRKLPQDRPGLADQDERGFTRMAA